MLTNLFDSLERSTNSARAGERVPDAPTEFMPELDIDILKNALDRQDRTPEQARKTHGEEHWLHASTLIHACTRELALHRAYGAMQTHNEVYGPDRIVWAMGRAAEAHLRKQFIAACNFEHIYGDWRCNCESEQFVGYHPADRQCQRCGSGLDNYHEINLANSQYRVTGAPDLLYDHHGYIVPIEVKSMKKRAAQGKTDGFDNLMGPKSEHIMQVLTYRRLLELAGFRVHDEAIIIYVCKDYCIGSPYKEFHVDATDPAYGEYAEEILSRAQQVYNATRSLLPPRLSKCETMDSTRAKSCPLVARCFGARA